MRRVISVQTRMIWEERILPRSVARQILGSGLAEKK
jgi:hypothetical protein